MQKHPGDALLSGSFVVSGRCMARVEHVGADNYASGIAAAARRFKKVHSELLSPVSYTHLDVYKRQPPP